MNFLLFLTFKRDLSRGVSGACLSTFPSFVQQRKLSGVGHLPVHEKLLAKYLSLYSLNLFLLAVSGSVILEWCIESELCSQWQIFPSLILTVSEGSDWPQHVFMCTLNDRHRERAGKETDRDGNHFMDFFGKKLPRTNPVGL